MYVNCVEGALVVFQADGRGSHGVVVLWADDDDDQVFFLEIHKNKMSLSCFHSCVTT